MRKEGGGRHALWRTGSVFDQVGRSTKGKGRRLPCRPFILHWHVSVRWIPAYAGMTGTDDSKECAPSMFLPRPRGQVPWP